MNVERLEVIVLDMPLRFSVEHAAATRKRAQNVFVAAHGDGHVGWGDCCPRPYVTGETVESVVESLQSKFAPRYSGRSFESFDACAAALAEDLDSLARDEHAAFCALELALLDLAGKCFGVSSGRVLGPVVSGEVRYSGIIATMDPKRVRWHALYWRLHGYREVKIKVGPDLDQNCAILSAARPVLGKRCSLRVDANNAWSGDEALKQVEALRSFGLDGVEQPCADLDGMARLTAAKLAPVVADESLCSMADAERLIENKACDIFNIRISKNGGLINAGRLHGIAQEHGLRCQLGAQVGETGLLSAAGRHFATRREGVVWCEGSFGKMLFKEEIAEPDIRMRRAGRARALDGPGLGVVPVAERVERYRCR